MEKHARSNPDKSGKRRRPLDSFTELLGAINRIDAQQGRGLPNPRPGSRNPAKIQESPVPHESFPSGKVPFRHVRELGRGSFAIVDEVEAPTPDGVTRQVFARKVLRVSQSQHLEEILKELEIMKALHHYHIVEVKLTYEEVPEAAWAKKAFGIIMEPVADCTLKEFLEALEDQRGRSRELVPKLTLWFGCLASGLTFIHNQRIRHKDIKPANILIKGNRILYSDFGISKAFGDEEMTSKTCGDPGKKTAMYCAPEVAAGQSRGRQSDVFSLGCVYAEMLTVICGIPLRAFADWRGPEGARAYHRDPDRTLRWLLHLQREPVTSRCVRYCIAALIPDPGLRVTAADLMRWICCSRQCYYGYRRCSCMGEGPVQSFCTVSLEGNPPHELALDDATPTSWEIAYKFWIAKIRWHQSDRTELPKLVFAELPAEWSFPPTTARDYILEFNSEIGRTLLPTF